MTILECHNWKKISHAGKDSSTNEVPSPDKVIMMLDQMSIGESDEENSLLDPDPKSPPRRKDQESQREAPDDETFQWVTFLEPFMCACPRQKSDEKELARNNKKRSSPRHHGKRPKMMGSSFDSFEREAPAGKTDSARGGLSKETRKILYSDSSSEEGNIFSRFDDVSAAFPDPTTSKDETGNEPDQVETVPASPTNHEPDASTVHPPVTSTDYETAQNGNSQLEVEDPEDSSDYHTPDPFPEAADRASNTLFCASEDNGVDNDEPKMPIDRTTTAEPSKEAEINDVPKPVATEFPENAPSCDASVEHDSDGAVMHDDDGESGSETPSADEETLRNIAEKPGETYTITGKVNLPEMQDTSFRVTPMIKSGPLTDGDTKLSMPTEQQNVNFLGCGVPSNMPRLQIDQIDKSDNERDFQFASPCGPFSPSRTCGPFTPGRQFAAFGAGALPRWPPSTREAPSGRLYMLLHEFMGQNEKSEKKNLGQADLKALQECLSKDPQIKDEVQRLCTLLEEKMNKKPPIDEWVDDGDDYDADTDGSLFHNRRNRRGRNGMDDNDGEDDADDEDEGTLSPIAPKPKETASLFSKVTGAFNMLFTDPNEPERTITKRNSSKLHGKREPKLQGPIRSPELSFSYSLDKVEKKAKKKSRKKDMLDFIAVGSATTDGSSQSGSYTTTTITDDEAYTTEYLSSDGEALR